MKTTLTPQSLAATVRRAVKAHTDVEAAEIAELLLTGWSDVERSDVLRVLLTGYVKAAIPQSPPAETKPSTTPNVEPSRLAARGSTLEPQDASSPRPTAGRSATPVPPRPSPKVALIRDAWTTRIEREEFYVDGARRALADLTREQVLAVAASNRDLARKIDASSDRLERIAEAMATNGADTVRDLSSRIGLAAWRTAA